MPAAPRLEEAFHAPVRFTVMAALVGVDRAEFSFVRDAAGVSDSVMSKQAGVLEGLGHLRISKGYVGKRPRTWYSLTRQGRAAFAGHLAALQEIADRGAALTAGPGGEGPGGKT